MDHEAWRFQSHCGHNVANSASSLGCSNLGAFVLHTTSHQAIVIPVDGLVFCRMMFVDKAWKGLDYRRPGGANEVGDRVSSLSRLIVSSEAILPRWKCDSME